MTLHDEILEQPAALERQLGSSEAALAAVAARLRDEPVDSVVIAARGSSDHAAIYGQYLLGVRNRLSVGLATPSVVSLYGAHPRVGRSLVIGISQSGASPDIVSVVASARREGAPTVAITNDPASPLAEAADHVIDLAAGPEHAVAATKTYTTSLLAIARLSVALAASDGNARNDLAALPAVASAALAVEARVESVARELAAAAGAFDRCVIVGRGFEYATAREWALKLKELARVFADPYSSADFLHGPIALVQPGIPVLVLAPSGAAAEGQRELLEDLAARAVETVVVSDDPETRAVGRWSSELPAAHPAGPQAGSPAGQTASGGLPAGLPRGVPEWLRPIVSILPAQLFAYHATIARGLDPDAPRYLAKVTRTL
jgi:glucosamine--fructose-6-phosphate aminotransferase (isomerizing)